MSTTLWALRILIIFVTLWPLAVACYVFLWIAFFVDLAADRISRWSSTFVHWKRPPSYKSHFTTYPIKDQEDHA